MKIQSKQLNINDAFKNYYYIIPQYQREYVWSEENVQQLLDDAYDEYKNNKDSEYFIGSIVVSDRKDDCYEVIDGQQRLTTLFLVMCSLLSIFKERNDKQKISFFSRFLSDLNYDGENNYRLILQYDDTNGVIKKMVDSTIDEPDFLKSVLQSRNSTVSIINILKAYSFSKNYFKEKLNNDFDDFIKYFCEKIVFMQIETPNISDALKIFETINERGIGLNPMDLLKNLIFQQLDSDKFERINQKWKRITSILERNKQKPLRFIRYFLMSNYVIKDNVKEVDVIREDEIYSWIKRHEDECGYKRAPFDFINKIYENAEKYIDFLNSRDDNQEINKSIEIIKKLSGVAFSQHYVMLLAAKDLPDHLFVYLVNQIEKLMLYYFVTKTQAKVYEAKFSKWADDLRDVVNSENQERALDIFISKSFLSEQERLEGEFKSMFLNLRLDSLQRNKIKYILSKLSNYVDSMRLNGREDSTRVLQYLVDGVEIEHIAPNNPTKEIINFYGGQDVYNNNKNKLGNLTLLEKSHNIVAGRGDFFSKKNMYINSNFYLTRSLVKQEEIGQNTNVTRINERLIEFNDWSIDNINKRQEMLLKLALEVWKIGKDGVKNIERLDTQDNYPNKEYLTIKSIEKKDEPIIKKEHIFLNNVVNVLDVNFNLDNLRGKKPKYFLYNKKQYNIESWIDMYFTVISLLKKEFNNQFDEIININESGRRPIILDYKNSNFQQAKEIRFEDGSCFYVETNLNSARIIKNLRKMFNLFKVDRFLPIYFN